MSMLSAIIIDDEELQRRVVKVALEAIDCAVLGEADDGEAGVAMASDLKPDLILLDIRMPKMDGLAALREITAAMPDAYVVMLTAIDEGEIIENCMIHGAKDYLKKNMPVQEMVKRLQRHADRLAGT